MRDRALSRRKISQCRTTQREISLLNRVANQRPIILLADTEEPSQIVEALQSGTRGYIPTSVSLAIATEAMRLVRAGASMLQPAASLRQIARIGKRHVYGAPDRYPGCIVQG
jgi:DNA-binding NarL/FixJ family response regulator